MSERTNVKMIRALNRIRRKVDADRFVIEDFLAACPYSQDELSSNNRKHDLVVWRHVGILWGLLARETLGKASNRFGRTHCVCFHLIENVENALNGLGYKDIKSAIIDVCEASKKPRELRVPFAAYQSLLKQYLGDSDEVETLAELTYSHVPSVMKI